MAYAHSKFMGAPLRPVSAEMGLVKNWPAMIATTKATRALPPQAQVRRWQEENLQAPKGIPVSRRDAMLYMTAEILSGLSLLSAEPAEARVGKLENKRKAMEKLQRLREEAESSKPKTDKKSTPLTPPRPKNSQQGSVGPVVEGTLP